MDDTQTTFSDLNSSLLAKVLQLTFSTKCLVELTRSLMSRNRSAELLTSWFQRRFFIIFYVSMGANDPWFSGSLGVTVANLNPRGMIGRIYMHCYILVNIEAVHVLHGFTQNFKKSFPHISLWKLMILRAWAIWTPGASLGRFM